MKQLQFKTEINALVAKVYSTMLGLDNKETYEAWVAEFNPTSTFEGSWEKGAKIHFIGTDKNGEKSGMACKIEENNPNKFVSIRSRGFVKGDVEITTGEDVEKWTGGLENYTFEENNGITTLTVEVDVADDYEDYFNQAWLKALNKLKSIIEN